MVHHQQEKPVLVSTNDPNNYKSSSTHRMASTSSDHGYFCAGFITSSVDVSLSNLVVPLPPVSNNSNSQHHQLHQSSGFHTTTTTNNSTDSMIYNLATGFEMIGFHTTTPPSDSYPHNSTSSGSSSYPMLESTTWQRNINTSSSSSLVPPAFRDSPSSSSSRSSQRYHHPALTNNKGLSLSLNSISSTTTNSFDHIIRHHHSLNNNQLPSPTPDSHEHGAGFSWKNTTTTHHHQASDQQFDILKASNYLISTQELLNEFCSLETKHQLSQDVNDPRKHKKMSNNKNGNDDEIAAAATTTNKITSSSDDQHHLCALGIVELQKRKKRLVFMLDELDRRYKHYNTQMKSIVSTFESVVGEGAASVYTSLASRAMSRHFRSLRDGIVNQIKAHNNVINGGCDNNTTKDRDHQLLTETTPRLRILDQALRQEKALQQMSLMESHPWRPQRGLPERSVSVLRAWLFEHFLHPYPSDVDKHILARQTGLSRSQVSNWFINARVRLWKPMVEEMYVEEIKDELQDNSNQNQPSSSISSAAATATPRMVQPIHNHQYGSEPPNNLNNPHHYNSSMHLHKPSETKPTQDQLLRIIDPENESLSSIVNHSTSHFDRLLHTNRSNYTHHPHEGFTSSTTAFGTAGHVSMDHQPGLLPYDIDHHLDLVQTNYVGLRGAEPPPPPPIEVTGGAHHVSLTLGLHQNSCGIVKNGRENVSLQQTFPNGQGSFFYTRDDHSHHHRRIEDHQEENSSQQVHQYNSLLRDDDDAGQQSNLPYRNLLGAQLLNDFGS